MQLPETKLEILHEIPGVCAWVGKRLEDGAVLNAVPFFTESNFSSAYHPLTTGYVLLADLARQAHLQNRIGNKFMVPNSKQIKQDLEVTYGEGSIEVLTHTYLRPRLEAETRRGLARHLTRVLRVNYIECGKNLYTDEARVRLKHPATGLLNIPDGIGFKDLKELANYLSTAWYEMERRLRAKHPELQSRSALFKILKDGMEEEVTAEVTDSPALLKA